MSSGINFVGNFRDNKDPFNNMSLGLIQNESLLVFTGHSTGPAISPAEETIWHLGTRYQFSTTAIIDSFSSSSVLDVGFPIFFNGTDSNGFVLQQLGFTNGQNRVGLAIPMLRVNQVVNVAPLNMFGDLYVYEDTPLLGGVPIDLTKVRSHIQIGDITSQIAIWSIPTNHTFLLKQFIYLMGNGDKSALDMSIEFIGHTGGTAQSRNPPVELSKPGNQIFDETFALPLAVPGGTDLEFVVNSATRANIGISVTIVGTLVRLRQDDVVSEMGGVSSVTFKSGQ